MLTNPALIVELLTSVLHPQRYPAREIRTRATSRAFTTLSADFRMMYSLGAVPDLVASCRGVVLEIGPGVGNQVDLFDSSRITRVVGVEPNAAMVPGLQVAVDRAGLRDKYEIANCGAEDAAILQTKGITEHSVDTILTVQVLCSVPEPQLMLAHLYKLLKPGGQLVFYEHIRSKDGWDSLVQKLYTPFWSAALDGCCLDRATDDWLQTAGKWDTVNLEYGEAIPSLFPRVWGRLVKAKDA